MNESIGGGHLQAIIQVVVLLLVEVIDYEKSKFMDVQLNSFK
jgi:hypothetical protein